MLKIVPTPPRDVEVRGAVERVEQHAVAALTLRVLADDDRLLVLLGGDDRDAFAPAERAQQYLVGDDVELLLLLALHVLAADVAEHVLEPRAPHLVGDHLGGDGQRREDPGEGALGLGMLALLLEHVCLQRHDGFVCTHSCG
ncbi:MAG: hypothetical protein U1F11_11020 [Steroidobacteraceae bacterium]